MKATNKSEQMFTVSDILSQIGPKMTNFSINFAPTFTEKTKRHHKIIKPANESQQSNILKPVVVCYVF